MDAIIITTTLGEDHRLVIDLPDMPVGPIKLTIEPDEVVESVKELTTEEVRALFRAAGFLSEEIYKPEELLDLSDEEIQKIGKLPPGARPSEELIDEDRGRY